VPGRGYRFVAAWISAALGIAPSLQLAFEQKA
jgi:hypothetical protein